MSLPGFYLRAPSIYRAGAGRLRVLSGHVDSLRASISSGERSTCHGFCFRQNKRTPGCRAVLVESRHKPRRSSSPTVSRCSSPGAGSVAPTHRGLSVGAFVLGGNPRNTTHGTGMGQLEPPAFELVPESWTGQIKS